MEWIRFLKWVLAVQGETKGFPASFVKHCKHLGPLGYRLWLPGVDRRPLLVSSDRPFEVLQALFRAPSHRRTLDFYGFLLFTPELRYIACCQCVYNFLLMERSVCSHADNSVHPSTNLFAASQT